MSSVPLPTTVLIDPAPRPAAKMATASGTLTVRLQLARALKAGVGSCLLHEEACKPSPEAAACNRQDLTRG